MYSSEFNWLGMLSSLLQIIPFANALVLGKPEGLPNFIKGTNNFYLNLNYIQSSCLQLMHQRLPWPGWLTIFTDIRKHCTVEYFGTQNPVSLLINDYEFWGSPFYTNSYQLLLIVNTLPVYYWLISIFTWNIMYFYSIELNIGWKRLVNYYILFFTYFFQASWLSLNRDSLSFLVLAGGLVLYLKMAIFCAVVLSSSYNRWTQLSHSKKYFTCKHGGT